MFIQLWDADEGGRVHMEAGKFAAIIRKVTEHLALDWGAKLTFEVSDGLAPMQLHRAAAPRIEGDAIRIGLSARPASCKPRDRWLAEQTAPAGCCSPSASASKVRCCG
jgi:hypothetical protein